MSMVIFMSEPHTSDVYGDFLGVLYIIICGAYVAPYIPIIYLLIIILNSAMLQFFIWCMFVST